VIPFRRFSIPILAVVLILLVSLTAFGAGVSKFQQLRASQTGSTGYALQVDRNLTSTSTNSAVVYLLQDHASDDQALLYLKQDAAANLITALGASAATVFQVGYGGAVTITPTTTVTTDAIAIAGNALTTADFLSLTADDDALNGGKYLNCIGGTGADTAVFTIGEDGATAITSIGVATNSLTITNNTTTSGDLLTLVGDNDTLDADTFYISCLGGTDHATSVLTIGENGVIAFGDGGTIDGVTGTDVIALTEATIQLSGAVAAKGIVTFDGGLTAAAHVGKLHGAGASGAAFSLGAGAAGVKAMSYYLNSTSITASHSLEGLYINVDYGVGATDPAPFGEAGRFRARLMGDSAMTVAGSHSTVEWGQAGASTTGLVCGSRSNLVFVDSTAGGGTITGCQAELYSGGASTDLSGARASILRMVIDGTITAANWGAVNAFEIVVPADLVSTNSYLVDTNATTADCDAKMRIMINGTTWWIPLDDAAD